MTTIHDDDPGSRSGELQRALRRLTAEYESLARRKDELELALAAGHTGFCRLRGRGELRVASASSQFKAELGWAPDAAPEWADIEARIHCDDRGTLADQVRAAFTQGNELDLVVRVEVPGRAVHWIALRGRVTRGAGEGDEELVIASWNVSAERRADAGHEQERTTLLEHERRLRVEAEAANRAKDEFLSVISHELRSPLNAILGWNRILSLKRREDPEVAAIAPRIEQSAKAQLKMVNDLLDLGRIGTGKLKVESRPMQLAKVTSLAVDLARPAAAAKGVDIVVSFQDGAGHLRGDPDRLQQVVGNLLSNAVKFTPSGGRISVTVRELDGFAELTVEDTGKGIARELLPYVFDRFRQGDSSSTRHASGLGLGLTLVREIVTLHGGTVSARSDGVDAGSSFVVRLPASRTWPGSKDDTPTDAARVTGAQGLNGLSILVVDDELDARTVVAESLRLEGARVTVVDSAGSAFQHFQAGHFDIVVTDIGMPDEDGYSLMRKLRKLGSGRRILAIAVTGYASRNDVAAAMEAGFDLHVPKPVDFDTFVPMVRRLAAVQRQ